MNDIEFAKTIFYLCEDIDEFDKDKNPTEEASRMDDGINKVITFCEDYLRENGIMNWYDKHHNIKI